MDLLELWDNPETISARRLKFADIRNELIKSRPQGTNWDVDFASFVKGWDEAFKYLSQIPAAKAEQDAK